MTDDAPILFCGRCSRELHPGRGDFFEVTIDAVADPFPPSLAEADVDRLRGEIERLLAQMSDLTAREALEQVHRRVVLHLCLACYRPWIENPAGS